MEEQISIVLYYFINPRFQVLRLSFFLTPTDDIKKSLFNLSDTTYLITGLKRNLAKVILPYVC